VRQLAPVYQVSIHVEAEDEHPARAILVHPTERGGGDADGTSATRQAG
jgi:hypothetical protein